MSQSERGLPSPDIQIRPHHLITDSVRGALRGRKEIQFLGDRIVNQVADKITYSHLDEDDDGGHAYSVDVLGETLEEEARFRDGVEDFLTRLRKLKPEDLVLLSPEKDGICQSCIVGRHCEFGDRNSRNEGIKDEDEILLEGIELLLREGGYQEGVDWEKSTIQLQLYDPGDQNLTDPTVAIPFVQSYSTLLIKAGVLKKLKITDEIYFGDWWEKRGVKGWWSDEENA